MGIDVSSLTERQTTRGRKAVYYEDTAGHVVAKRCSDCGEVKAVDEFHRKKDGVAGRRANCNACQSERDRNYYAANADRIKEKEKERSRKHYAENAGRIKEYQRKHYAENAARIKERNRNHYADLRNDPVKWAEYLANQRVHTLNYRAMKRALPHTFTPAERDMMIDYFNGRCALTGELTDDLDYDHFVPLADGHGGTTRGNMVPMKGELNRSKGDRNAFEWFAANKERLKLDQSRFDAVIEYLADINGMTTQEYEAYTRWCHDNPRSVEQVRADNAKQTKPERKSTG